MVSQIFPLCPVGTDGDDSGERLAKMLKDRRWACRLQSFEATRRRDVDLGNKLVDNGDDNRREKKLRTNDDDENRGSYQ
jgi:hypothetical protein